VERVVVRGSDLVCGRRSTRGAIDGTVNTTGTIVDGVAGRASLHADGARRSYAFFILGGAVVLLGILFGHEQRHRSTC
jgi:hypothetical protein